jgi:F0F1-type ATP synthase assembly protein I
MASVAKVRWPLIVVLAAVGVVWLGQGIGVIDGSFMTGEPLWAIIGAVMLLGAGVLTLVARRGR